VRVDLGAIGLGDGGRYDLHDELTGDRYEWEGEAGWVRLDPTVPQVAHVFHVTR
jgi:starch synthase (maltosyl-transferring)